MSHWDPHLSEGQRPSDGLAPSDGQAAPLSGGGGRPSPSTRLIEVTALAALLCIVVGASTMFRFVAEFVAMVGILLALLGIGYAIGHGLLRLFPGTPNQFRPAVRWGAAAATVILTGTLIGYLL